MSEQSVHRARRCFKQAAALFRLLEAIDREKAQAGAVAVRGFRRILGDVRDLDVLAETLSRFEERLSADVAERLRRRIDAARSAAKSGKRRVANVADIAQGLKDLAALLAAWPPDCGDRADLVVGLTRSYRRAQSRGEKAVRTREVGDLHEFRKALIVFREQMIIFEPVWPKLFAAVAAEAQALRNLLGELNDLALLRDFAAAGEGAEIDAVEAALAPARARAFRRLEPAWRRLFAEPPEALAARLETWIAFPKKKPR